MPVVLIKSGKVVQIWETKPIEDVARKLGKNADLRELDASWGDLVSSTNKITKPTPRIKTDAELEEIDLEKNYLKFQKTVIRALQEIRSADPSIMSTKTKTALTQLESLLRS